MTATKKECAVWTIGENWFEESIRKDFTEFLEKDDIEIVYLKPIIDENNFKLLIGFEDGTIGLWNLASDDEFEKITVDKDGVIIVKILQIQL